MRFLIYIADQSVPSGGTNVALQIVSVLNHEGFSALPLFGGRRCHYTGGTTVIDGVYSRDFREPAPLGLRGKAKAGLRHLKWAFRAASGRGHKPNEPVDLRPDDVLVVPDYALSWAGVQCPGVTKVAMVQGMGPLFLGLPPEQTVLQDAFKATIATSRACLDVVHMMGLPHPGAITLAVSHPDLRFQARKSRRIAYMPRKLPAVSRAVVTALSRRPELQGYDFVAIDKMSRDEVVAVLNDALFFLSFVDVEGFGLPAAEAMLAGCVVIGFVGVGGAEFYTPSTGVVVPDGDAVALFEAVRQTVLEYESAPARLDALRHHASREIETRYTEDAFRQSVVSAFGNIRNALLEERGRTGTPAARR